MTTLFLRHKVTNYESWRSAYDGDVGRRDAAGLTEVGVFRDASDPNMVLLVWNCSNVDKAKEMVNSPDLGTKMKDAGVVSTPELWFGDAFSLSGKAQAA